MSDPIDFDCPHCGNRLIFERADLVSQGGQVHLCAACGREFTLPLEAMLPPSTDGERARTLQYEAPELPLTRGSGVWRDATLLVMVHGGSLPRRCPKCNGKVALFRRLDLRLAKGLARFSLIARLATQHTASVKVGLCTRHDRALTAYTYGWIWCLILAFGLLVASSAMPTQWGDAAFVILKLPAVMLFVAGALWLRLRVPLLSPVQIDNHYIYLAGCDAQFLASLADVSVAHEVQAKVVTSHLGRVIDDEPPAAHAGPPGEVEPSGEDQRAD